MIVVLAWFFAGRIDWPELGRALRRAERWPIVLAAALYFSSLFGKALLWRILLAPRNIVHPLRLFRYTIAAYAASALAPARAGEVLRVLALRQHDGVSAADASGVAVTDKLLHAVMLLVLAAPLPLLVPTLPDWVGRSLLVGGAIAAALLVAIYIAVGRVSSREPRSWFARFLTGMRTVREPGRLMAALGVVTIVWLVDLVTLLAVMAAVDIEVGVAGGLFVMFTTNLAIAIPATPANFGTLHLGALVGTALLGVPREPALAFALLYHAVQILPVLAVGAFLELRLVFPPSGKLAG